MSLIKNKAQLEVIDKFVKDLDTSLGVEHKKISFDQLWESNPPTEAEGLSLQDYMKDVCIHEFMINGVGS